MSCLDTFCPLSSRPARNTPSAPWLSDILREHLSKLRAAERVWRKSQYPTDLNLYRSLLSDFSANVSTAKRTYYYDKINNSPNSRMLFKTFSSLLCPPPPPPSSTLTANDFATFFINKITNLTAHFPHHKLSNTSYLQTYTRSHPSLHSLRQKSLNSSFPSILLLVRLILFHLISFKPFFLQLYLHSLKLLTHPFTLEFFPQHLNRLI